MCVLINVINISGGDTQEHQACECLKKMFMNTLPADASGSIWIASGLNIPNQTISDIDILILGQLHNCNLLLHDNTYCDVRSFCTVVELKEHPIDNIQVQGFNVSVKYSDTYKSATTQNEGQKYTLINYLKSIGINNVYVSNILWLKSVSAEELAQYSTDDGGVNALPNTVSFADYIRLIRNNKYPILNAIKPGSQDPIPTLISRLFVPRSVPSKHTLKKVHSLTEGLLDDTSIELMKESGLRVVSGAAGTGKTFLLLQTAIKLAQTQKKCLILTYNKALTLDLRRLLSYFPYNSGRSDFLQIRTIASFLYDLAKCLKIGYRQETVATSMSQFIKQKIDNARVSCYLECPDFDLDYDYDYVLIDEAQDVSDAEKAVLTGVFGDSRIIVAEGNNQIVRNNPRASWPTPSKTLNTGLRQKKNIVSFLHVLAREMNLSQSCVGCIPSESLIGGRVIITSQYTEKVHKDIEQQCRSNEASNYDILMLVPPQMVKDGIYRNTEIWKQKGMKFIDGVASTDSSIWYNSDSIEDCARLYQYQSCRGLEGWVTVCMHFDELIECKTAEFSRGAKKTQTISNPVVESKLQAYEWGMIPLTRAIDTLIITLKDTNSEIAGLLRSAASQCCDFVTCNI